MSTTTIKVTEEDFLGPEVSDNAKVLVETLSALADGLGASVCWKRNGHDVSGERSFRNRSFGDRKVSACMVTVDDAENGGGAIAVYSNEAFRAKLVGGPLIEMEGLMTRGSIPEGMASSIGTVRHIAQALATR